MISISSGEDQLQTLHLPIECILKQLLSLYLYKLQTLQVLAAIDKKEGLYL